MMEDAFRKMMEGVIREMMPVFKEAIREELALAMREDREAKVRRISLLDAAERIYSCSHAAIRQRAYRKVIPVRHDKLSGRPFLLEAEAAEHAKTGVLPDSYVLDMSVE